MGLTINRRRVMGGKRLPYDAEVEYLEGSGTQWIDTGIVPNRDDVVMIVDAQKVQSVNDTICFGMKTYNQNDFAINLYGSVKLYWWYGGRSGNVAINVTERHLYEIGNSIRIDSTKIQDVTISNTFVGNSSKLTLFGMGNQSVPTGVNYPFYGRIFSSIIRYGNDVILDFIPVRIGQLGYMYDKVSGQLFGNAGTGDFIVGPDKN